MFFWTAVLPPLESDLLLSLTSARCFRIKRSWQLYKIVAQFGIICETATSCTRWEGMGTPSVPYEICNKHIPNTVCDQWSFKPLWFLCFGAMAVSSLTWCRLESNQYSHMEMRVWNLEENPCQDRWKLIVYFVLFIPEAWMSKVWLVPAWHSSFTSLTWNMQIVNKINCQIR